MASAMAGLLPPHPVNGLGSLISQVPMGDDGPMWWYGSTYDHSRQNAVCLAADQATNLAQLQSLLPQLAGWVLDTEDADAFATTKTLGLRNWAGVRCTTSDRLPVVGSLAPLGAPGVHLLTALGSRGITLSMLCGHLLAAQICGEPWPMDPAIAHLLRPERFKKQT
jgi:tRNA 5-methylaminomethyl-2-thiouridine biosynthesis bifunctional protein